MPLPVKNKTWIITPNQSQLNHGTTPGNAQDLAFGISNILNGLIGASVLGSSDSATAGLDNVDRWNASSKIIATAAAGAHSWKVWKFTGLGTNVQLLWDFGAGTTYECILALSQGAGFTGGSTTARPTATDEYIFNSNTVPNAWGGGNNSSNPTRYHVWQSDDGACIRVAIFSRSACTGIWILDLIQGVDGAYTLPVFAACVAGDPAAENCLSTAWTTLAGNKRGRSPGGTNYQGIVTCVGGAAALQSAGFASADNQITGQFNGLPAHVGSTTSGALGLHGYLADTYMGSDIAYSNGDTFIDPAFPGNRLWMRAGCLILPWTEDATIPKAA